MSKSKSFLELSKNIEILSENEQGQLRGGFAVFSSIGLENGETNPSCTVNNCNCETNNGKNCNDKNKNRRNCSGCSGTGTSTGLV